MPSQHDQELVVFQPLPEEQPPEAPLPPSRADALLEPLAEKMDRRAFMKLGAGLTASLLIMRQFHGHPQEQSDKPEPTYEPKTGNKPFNPEVKIRKVADEFGDHEPSEEGRQTVAQRLRRLAPVFTLVHTVKKGETTDELSRRYYSTPFDGGTTKDETNGIARKALTAANMLNDQGDINVDQTLYVPISEPVAVKKDGKKLHEIAAEWGFSEESVQAVNEGREQDPEFAGLEDWLYLPVQQMPDLAEDERNYVLEHAEGGPTSYYGIANELGTGLSTLVGRNKPDPTKLEYGHVLVVSTEPAEPEPPTTTITEPATTTTTASPSDPVPVPPTQPRGGEDGVTPADLIAKRTWVDAIDEDESVSVAESELEQDITIERIEEIALTAEGYQAFVDSINTQDFKEVFEKGQTVERTDDGDPLVLDDPDFFVIHHTAAGIAPGTEGLTNLTSAMIRRQTSVQWAITQENQAYQLVSDPKIMCWHARGHNPVSTGVELVTDESKAQGSVTTEQLTSAMYLAYYVVTEIYGKTLTTDNVHELVVGHREINDRTKKGTGGKPDFYENAMDAFRTKLSELITAMA